MKKIIILCIFMWTSSGFSLQKEKNQDLSEGTPRNLCAYEPDGTIFSVVHNCNQFIMCQNGEPTVGRCRAAEPHFHKCFFRCVNDLSVCTLTSCDGVPSPPPPTTTLPPGSTTTTEFVIPTVPGVTRRTV